jgi:NAD(P)-dependent dehydrogenase (short-subunit alcohol dehydrogenase family)
VETEVRKLATETVALQGRLDAAFNKAGIELDSPLTNVTQADYCRMFDINVWGVACARKHEIAAMLATGGGSIVNTSSIAGRIGIADFSLYNASKHAVEGLTNTTARKYARQRFSGVIEDYHEWREGADSISEMLFLPAQFHLIPLCSRPL